MVYVSSSGQIGSSPHQPWGLAKIIGIFWAILNFFYMLFRTLINPDGWSSSSSEGRGGGGGGGGGGGRGAGPFHVTGESDLASRLKTAGSKLVVIDFYATWCGPCQMIAPIIEQMAAEMSDVVFLKVDVDECDTIAATYAVRAMPTMVFIKNGRKVDSFSGANVERLRDTVNRYR